MSTRTEVTQLLEVGAGIGPSFLNVSYFVTPALDTLYQLNSPTILERSNYGLILQLSQMKLRKVQSLAEGSEQRGVQPPLLPLHGLEGLEETRVVHTFIVGKGWGGKHAGA